jgi:hypothetical protein
LSLQNRQWLFPLIIVLLASLSSTSIAQQPTVSTDAVQVIGMTGFKNNSKGRLEITDGALIFKSAKNSATVSLGCIDDVVTGRDSERVLRGPVGTLSMLAPYGGGRALSLMRTKLDTITIKYRDLNGGLHGAIFTMHPGEAEAVKQALLAQGAHTSIPTAVGLESTAPAQSEAKEQTQ